MLISQGQAVSRSKVNEKRLRKIDHQKDRLLTKTVNRQKDARTENKKGSLQFYNNSLVHSKM